MLPLQPSLADDREAERLEFLQANGLPDDHQPDPEDLQPWLLIDEKRPLGCLPLIAPATRWGLCFGLIRGLFSQFSTINPLDSQ